MIQLSCHHYVDTTHVKAITTTTTTTTTTYRLSVIGLTISEEYLTSLVGL